MKQSSGLVDNAKVIRVGMSRLKLLRSKVARDSAMISIAAGLGHDLDDTASRLAVLRLIPAGLDFNFLNKGQVDTGAERTVGTREDSQAAEGRVGNVHTISNILVLETRSARY